MCIRDRYLVSRQPFPGPGLGIRIIGEVTPEKVTIVQDADAIWREEIAKAGLDTVSYTHLSQLTIAVGCTGGKHRSITFARKLAEYCTSLGYEPGVQHRDAEMCIRDRLQVVMICTLPPGRL